MLCLLPGFATAGAACPAPCHLPSDLRLDAVVSANRLCARPPPPPPPPPPAPAQVLAHPWLSEVAGLIAQPRPQPADADASRAAEEPPAPSPGFEDRLHSAARDLASLGFSPGTPVDNVPGVASLLRCGAP